MKEKWETNKAPIPTSWIAQVSKDESIGIAYISGLISETANDGVQYGLPVADQTRLIMENLKTIVTEMGLDMGHVIKTNIFMKDLKDFDEMNSVYKQYFDYNNPPTRQCVQAGIWGGLDVEISSVVVL